MTWNTLSKINVNDHTEKKGNLTYLSWAWAWQKLMEHYPESVYQFEPNEYHPDGSVTVHCTLTVDGITRPMWLPVMDNRNNAVMQPNSRAISDTKMRCLVKAIAMFGLGSYIYAGEDLPQDTTTISPEQRETLSKLISATKSDEERFCQAFKCSSISALLETSYGKAFAALEKKKSMMEAS
jgi:hypothetical protein